MLLLLKITVQFLDKVREGELEMVFQEWCDYHKKTISRA